MKSFLYGTRPVRDDPTHPSMGFDRPCELVFAIGRAEALAMIDPALFWSNPDQWRAILDGSHPSLCLMDYTRLDDQSSDPIRMDRDAADYLRPFGFHYGDEEQCSLCYDWEVNLCTTCGYCKSCKSVADIFCVVCGPFDDPTNVFS